MFGIYAGTDSGDVQELMRVVVDETAAAAGSITEAEVNRAKAQIKVGLLMALESSGARARQLANQILVYGRPLPIEELVARIDNVTAESTRAAGTALMARGRSAIAALGPGEGLEGAATIVESLSRRAA
jgi:predicted Zn-dependent peptidase